MLKVYIVTLPLHSRYGISTVSFDIKSSNLISFFNPLNWFFNHGILTLKNQNQTKKIHATIFESCKLQHTIPLFLPWSMYTPQDSMHLHTHTSIHRKIGIYFLCKKHAMQAPSRHLVTSLVHEHNEMEAHARQQTNQIKKKVKKHKQTKGKRHGKITKTQQ